MYRWKKRIRNDELVSIERLPAHTEKEQHFSGVRRVSLVEEHLDIETKSLVPLKKRKINQKGSQKLDDPVQPEVSFREEKNRETTNINSVSPHELLEKRGHCFLAVKEDQEHLNALHCFVRENIEVFVAGDRDIKAPAPGRKIRIVQGQVGLRCIYCYKFPSCDRVKRAVCYPSTVSRIYHSVSDMKFDHFSGCQNLPKDKKETFARLKRAFRGSRSVSVAQASDSCSTAKQYYHESALKLGLMDNACGIFLSTRRSSENTLINLNKAAMSREDTPRSPFDMNNSGLNKPLRALFPSHVKLTNDAKFCVLQYQHLNVATKPSLFCTSCELPSNNEHFTSESKSMRKKNASDQIDSSLPLSPRNIKDEKINYLQTKQTPIMLLAMPKDKSVLNPLHCFVRENVEVFSASGEDIAAPAPGRKQKVSIGQVGIRCIHCTGIPAKIRVKRAVCYPPSVNGIYHSLSNMKFDHFSRCTGMPTDLKTKFLSLRETYSSQKGDSSRKGKNGTRKGSSSFTAQYYCTTAKNMGLVDTCCGIRFSSDRTCGCILKSHINQIKRPHSDQNSCILDSKRDSISVSEKDVLNHTQGHAGEGPGDGLSALMIAASVHAQRVCNIGSMNTSSLFHPSTGLDNLYNMKQSNLNLKQKAQ